MARFVNAVQNLSAFVLYPVVAWCSDRYGRKTTLGINFLWLALAVGLQTAATNPTMFVFGRVFIGTSASFTSGSAPILMAETAYSHTSRYHYCHVYRWLVRNWSWRIPSLLQCAIPILALPGFLMAPGNLLRGRGNRHRSFISVTLGVFAQWNGLGIVSYYLAPVLRSIGITSVKNQTMISEFLQLWNLILSIGAAFNVDRFGRHPLFLVSSVGMLCASIEISGLSGSFLQTNIASTGTAVIPFLFIYYGFYEIALTPLPVSYTCEIWPYDLRAKGLALAMNSTRVALFFNTFVNPIILDATAWKYYIVYCVILAVTSVTIWLWYPETSGYTLEETAALFDPGRQECCQQYFTCRKGVIYGASRDVHPV
ncbi:major facilitator superfamily domain-containing protein [Aspergillus foveolatus]|uniref:major facilitator superfamily domain-containing protein n=1 Tax=Aspergillus foveolatus TaxID=210207 RepID=UPI003CCCDBA0